MNTRIKELLKQTGFCSYYNAQDEQIAEFAELLIKECVNVALNNSHRLDDMGAIIANQIRNKFEI